MPIPYTLNPNQLLSILKKPFDEYDEGPYFPEDYNLVNNFNINGDPTGDGTNTQVVNVNNNVHLLDYYYTGVIDDYNMNNDDDFDVIDNTLNISVNVDDIREDEMEEEENNNRNNNKKTNQSIVGYTKTVNLDIDLNKAFNWYRENNIESSIGRFELENNEAPEITVNGDYTTTDTNNNNYQEIDSYTPPALMESTEPNTKKTRSLYSNYFRVNVPPPTITEPVTSNGYYKFNGNSLISGTNQDYNLNINVNSSSTSIINISSFTLSSSLSNTYLLKDLNTISGTSLTVDYLYEAVCIYETSTSYVIQFITNQSASAKYLTLPQGTRFLRIKDFSDYLYLKDDNNNTIITIRDNTNKDKNALELNKTNFNLIFY